MCNPIHHGRHREKPCRKECPALPLLQAGYRQDPNAQPNQIEAYEESLWPYGNAKQHWEAILESSEKFVQKMQALPGQSNQEEIRCPLTARRHNSCRHTQYRKEKRDYTYHREPGSSNQDAAQIVGHRSQYISWFLVRRFTRDDQQSCVFS